MQQYSGVVGLRSLRTLIALALVLVFLGGCSRAETLNELVGRDIGTVGLSGSHTIRDDVLVAHGSGADIWSERDGFYFVSTLGSGDTEVIARIDHLDETHPWAKAGVMVRASLDPGSRNVMILMAAQGRVSVQRRLGDGVRSLSAHQPEGFPQWVRLVRRGDVVEAFTRSGEEDWSLVQRVRIDLPTAVHVGFAVTSHDNDAVAEVRFEAIQIGDPDPQQAWSWEEYWPMLHGTPEEVAVWRDRAANGPYRLQHDVHTDSPNDWQRILDRSDVFLGNPTHARYTADGLQLDSERCVASSARNDPNERGGSLDLRHAAFRYLITGETAYRDAVRAELLAQSRESAVDFSNRSLWCNGKIYSLHPNFRMGNWMNRFLVAYDYLGPDSFTPSEHEHLRAWFRAAAIYMITDINLVAEKSFRDRYNDDYTLTPYARAVHDQHAGEVITHYGGYEPGPLALWTYQNRFASMARYVGIAGLLLEDPILVDHAKRFFREWLMFSVYPDNTPAEFNRWTSSDPNGGLGYAASVIAEYIYLADHLARQGDTELYDFTTSRGAFGTEGGTKSLLGTLHNYAHHIDGTLVRYATRNPDHVGDPKYRINDVDPARNRYSVFEVYFMPAARYYDDPYLNDLVYRTGPNMNPYPPSPIGKGPAPVWEGQAALYPAMLLMHAHMPPQTNPHLTLDHLMAQTHQR